MTAIITTPFRELQFLEEENERLRGILSQIGYLDDSTEFFSLNMPIGTADKLAARGLSIEQLIAEACQCPISPDTATTTQGVSSGSTQTKATPPAST